MDPERRERTAARPHARDRDRDRRGDPGIREVEELRAKIEEANLPEAAQSQAERELQRLAALPQHAPDRHLIRTYIEWMATCPGAKETEDKLELPAARESSTPTITTSRR